MSRLLALALVVAIALPGCRAAGQDHGNRLATEEAVTAALNDPAGADYPRALAAIEASGQSASQRDLAAGNLILSACREAAAFCAAPNDAAAGVARLTSAAKAGGEDATIAANQLATWYRRGAGATLPADPKRAGCWDGVAKGTAEAASCVP